MGKVVRRDNKQKVATVQRYVNILSNAGFKAFFGDVNNKEAVISILNVVLPELCTSREPVRVM